MQKANSISAGILLGLIFPAVAWFIDGRLGNIPYLNKPGVLYLIAVALNLVILRYYYKKNADEACTGIMLATFTCMLAAFILKIKY